MKRLAATFVLIVAAVVLLASDAQTAPKPSEVAINWQLDVRLDTPRPIEVSLPGKGQPTRFWYLLYTVTNRTGEDRIFVPEFVLYTNTGQILRAGQKVPTAVFRKLKRIYNDPLLKDRMGMTGKLLQGEDNARSGVAIWREFDGKAGSFDLFLGGFSGETAEVILPIPVTAKEIDARGRDVEVVKEKIILTKTMQLNFSAPGEQSARSRLTPKLLKRQWVMR